MASVPDSAAPSLFLRNATGLVKGWSGFDAFSYSFMSVNLVTLGMFYSLAVFAYVPAANPILSIVLAAIAVTFLAVAYSGLIAAMPRAGVKPCELVRFPAESAECYRGTCIGQ